MKSKDSILVDSAKLNASEEAFIKRWLADGAYICPENNKLTDFSTCSSTAAGNGCKYIKTCEAVDKHLKKWDMSETEIDQEAVEKYYGGETNGRNISTKGSN